MRGPAMVWVAAVAGTLLSIVSAQVWPHVTISSGNIIGRNFTSDFTNKFMYAFQGIPYGAPPVGTYRFKPPQPPANWTYRPYLNCTADGPVCYQVPESRFLPSSYVMAENCLNLNVYSSSLTEKQPVMVWIHGGANVIGSAAYPTYAPDMLVAEGVVVVSINYRLGALGFLTLGTSEAPGNAALYDAILALKWVQTNIAQFGGDPTKVTIWGESSGSTLVHLLYLSPQAKGLFQGAIAESGTALMNAVWQNGSSYGFQLAQALNCGSSSDPSSTLECLQLVPVDDLVNAQNNVSVGFQDSVTGNWIAWRANVDQGLVSQPLLPDLPDNLWLQNQGSNVPILFGTVVDEGVVKLASASDDEIKNITDNLQYFIPETTRNSLSQVKLANLTQSIRNFYFPNNSTAGPTNIHPFVDLLGDYMFKYGTSVSARMYKQRQSNVYLYLFNYAGGFTGTDPLAQKYNTTFIGHGSDLQYLFVPDGLTALPPAGDPDLLVWQRMARMWANFAKTGIPTSALDQDTLLQNVSWTSVGPGDKTYYLNIGVNLTMVQDAYLKDTVALWDPIQGGVPSSPSSGNLQVTVSLLAAVVVAVLNYF